MGYLDLTMALQVFFQLPFKLSMSLYRYWPPGYLLSQQAHSPPLSLRASMGSLYILGLVDAIWVLQMSSVQNLTFHLNIWMIKSPYFHIPTPNPVCG